MTVVELLAQIARRDRSRSAATLQADIRQGTLTAPLSLSAENVVTADLETPVGVRRRIDIEVGYLPDRGQTRPRGRERPDRCDQATRRLPRRTPE